MPVTLSKGYIDAAKREGEKIRKTLSPGAQRVAELVAGQLKQQNAMKSIEHNDGSVTTAWA
jgi:hypothetical protein